jgi:prophage tail gpP-like protein
MAFEIVTLSAAGLTLQPQTIAVDLAYDEAARSFSAKVKHPFLDQAALLAALAGSPPCTISTVSGDEPFAPAGGDLLLTGHVEKRAPRLAGDEKEMTISGRSKTGDAVDSAAEHDKGEFRDKDAKAIIEELASKQGITVENEATLKKRKVFRLRPGETIFAAAERLARVDGVTITDTPEGNLKFAQAAKKNHSGEIRDGDNGWPHLVDASALHDDSRRFGKVKVSAQAPDGYKPEDLRVEGEASDSAAGRQRLRVVIPPEQVAREDARKRAQWHRDRAAGQGTTCEVRLVGWRDAGGTLWTPGWNIYTEIADLGLAQDMTIQKVSLAQSEEGTFASLSLVDPRAFGGKKGKGGKSGKGWDLGKAGGEDA